MIIVVSTYNLTPIVPANSGGPYVVDGGSPVTLGAAVVHADATYAWDFGDGASAVGSTVTHTYADDGLYTAKLTVIVNRPGGARSRHFARIRVRNVPPKVNAGPDRTVNEGDEVAFVGNFSDPEWPDTHEATWDWGDSQAPDAGVVSETHNPPAATGTVAGKHAWGDNGDFTVTLTVRDDDGGVGTDGLQVKVLNVPPTVDAGPDLFAYPCTVITLRGNFTDPGWLDTHTGTWDFGDCTPTQPAVVREENDPPAATGVAIASHVYADCGIYSVLCTVVDDDGGVGQDATIVRVVDVVNPDLETGFRPLAVGSVGNGWDPYGATIEAFASPSRAVVLPAQTYAAEEFVVHGGQRAQRVTVRDVIRAGMLQQVGANPHWDYQVTAWYALSESDTGTVRLGLDPTGGRDPTSSDIVWVEGSARGQWTQLAVRATATATAKAITIFVEAVGSAAGRPADTFFDDIALLAVQPFCPPEAEPPQRPPEETCVNFADVAPGTQVPAEYVKDGFTFRAATGGTQVASWGVPVGVSKLLVVAPMLISLPFPSSRVRVRITHTSKASLELVAFDATGLDVSRQTTPPVPDVVHTVEFVGSAIAQVGIRGVRGEALLVDVCAVPDSKPPRKSATAVGVPMRSVSTLKRRATR